MNHRRLAALILLLIVTGIAVGQARSMPAFARRYGVSCARCHNPFPRVTEFGEAFAGSGFRLVAGEAAPDTVATGDPLLTLSRSLPLAVRVDAQAQLFTGGGASATDLQTPWVVKLLSSAPLTKEPSYHFYLLLHERGETAGIEDAFVYWNDLGGRPADIAVGQFQVSDPLFKRETRLMSEDYAIYRSHVGDLGTDLTHDRGLMRIAEVGNATVTLELVNGNGIGAAGGSRRLDDIAFKNEMGQRTRGVLPGRARLGTTGYVGRSDGSGPGGVVRSETWMVGADATLSGGPVDVNLQYVHRVDRRPTYLAGEPNAVTDGGFVEVMVTPGGRRTYGFALLNHVQCDRPLLDPRDGGPAGLTRYQTVAGGAGYLLARNVHLQGEAGYDLERERGRLTLGMTLGY